MRQGGRKIVRQQAAAAVYISVGVFFIKMLREEVTSPASVLITAEMEAEALCQRECKVALAARAFCVPARALGHLAVCVSVPTTIQRLPPLAGEDREGDPSSPPSYPPSRGQSRLPACCPDP